jgi:hypothetical protein
MNEKEFDKLTSAISKLKIYGSKPTIFSKSIYKKIYQHKNKGKMIEEFDRFLKIIDTEYDISVIEQKPQDLLKSKKRIISLFESK